MTDDIFILRCIGNVSSCTENGSCHNNIVTQIAVSGADTEILKGGGGGGPA